MVHTSVLLTYVGDGDGLEQCRSRLVATDCSMLTCYADFVASASLIRPTQHHAPSGLSLSTLDVSQRVRRQISTHSLGLWGQRREQMKRRTGRTMLQGCQVKNCAREIILAVQLVLSIEYLSVFLLLQQWPLETFVSGYCCSRASES